MCVSIKVVFTRGRWTFFHIFAIRVLLFSFFHITLKKQEMKNVELQVRVLVTVNLPSCPVLVDEEGGKYDTNQWSHPASTSAKQV